MRSLFIIFSFLASIQMVSQDTIVKSASEWKYYDQGNLQGEEWTLHFIEDSLWKTGIAPFGYGESEGLNTVIDYGGDEENKHLVSYYIKKFTIDNPSDAFVYELKLRRDDGAIVYLNGKEVWRSNIADKNAKNNGRASVSLGNNEEAIIHSKLFPIKYFEKGKNRLSVAIYQGSVRTSDSYFDLALIGHSDTKYLSQLLQLQEEENSQLNNQLKELALKQEIRDKETEYRFLENSKRLNIFIEYALLALLLASIIFGLWYYQKIKKKLKANEKLLKSLEEHKEVTEKEMLNKSFHNLKHNQYLKELQQNLKDLLGKIEVNKHDIQKVINSIDHQMSHEEEWNQLENQFNVVHSGFIDKLKHEFPSLSATEQRHCIFIKLLIPTKEIARLMNIEPRSVQATRYRIKKKMELTEEQSLKDFIISL